jgi:outer membrane protein insertion porin family
LNKKHGYHIIGTMSSRFFLSLIAVVSLVSLAFAQENPAVSEMSTSPAAELTVTQPETVPAPAPAKTVVAIETKGNKAISSITIISKMKTKVGAPYLDNVISDDLKRLYLLGFFGDIKIDTEDVEGGLKVIITVVERPLIDKITFTGISRLRIVDKKLKETLKSKEGQYLDYPSLDEDAQTITQMYQKIGFSHAEVTYKADVNPATNKVLVSFTAIEGGRVKIKNIFVEGNIAFPDKRILKLIKTKRAWLFNPGTFKDDVFKEDIERIRAFYQRNGYSDVTVDYEVTPYPAQAALYIAIKVVEGKKYFVGSIAVHGNKDIEEKEILGQLKAATPDKVYSLEAVKMDVANIQSLYFDRGYIFCQVLEATSVNPDTGRVDVVYTITENEIAYVDKIKVRGNIKTKDIVIRREMRIKPGDRFDGGKLKRSKERLQNLGFFDEVNYDTEDTADPNKKDLVVDVKEAKTGSFSFGGGYSTVDQFVGFVEIEQKNFDWRNFPYFTGAGQDLKVRAGVGTLRNGFDISFTEPWLFDYPVSAGFDAYKQNHERDEDAGYGYNEDVTGGDLRMGKQLSEYLSGNITYRYDIITISDITEDASADLKKEEGKNVISSLQFGLNFDSRDNVFDPVRGNLLSGTWEIAGGPFGGDKDYMKFYGRASHNFPLPRNSTLEIRGRVGLADPYGNSEDIPIYGRFFAGGTYTIRGYDERMVGPLDPISQDPLGGEALLIGNLEYTYPLTDFFKVAAFFDSGNVWAKMKDFASGGYKSGFGVGVRIKTPLGPVMLDYGIPLNKIEGEEEKGSGKFHFSMSHGF